MLSKVVGSCIQRPRLSIANAQSQEANASFHRLVSPQLMILLTHSAIDFEGRMPV
jgi:hypothetical protein